MPLLRINADPRMAAPADTRCSVLSGLAGVARAHGPAIIMLHGYKYDPSDPNHCPHRKIFAGGPDGWPRALGFGCGSSTEGIGIAFGWYARGPVARVHHRAGALARNLAGVVRVLRTKTPDRPVHIIAHSMGAETALSALAHLPAGSVNRMLLLTGASFAGHARRMLATPAGRTTELINITSRENDLFDMAFEQLALRDDPRDRAIGLGINAPNAVTIQIDCTDTLTALACLGYPVAAPTRRICHWSAYTRPGVMKLYAGMLRSPEDLSLARLRRHLPADTAPRWSRLFDGLTPCLKRLHSPVTLPALALAPGLKTRIMAGPPTRRKHNEHAC